jgi:hypothetical protein
MLGVILSTSYTIVVRVNGRMTLSEIGRSSQGQPFEVASTAELILLRRNGLLMKKEIFRWLPCVQI